MTYFLLGFTIFVCIIVLATIFYGISIYNSLVSLKNQVQRAWANIDVILKQRNDVIPNLVSVCEQFANYERGTLQKIVEARAHYGTATSINDKIKAAQEVTQALRGLFALSEAYPELKSSQQFVQLQQTLVSLENQLADRRELYNENVTNYNTRIAQFPDVLFAQILNFTAMSLFQVSEAEKAMPSVKMSLPA
jgi:LemA protein